MSVTPKALFNAQLAPSSGTTLYTAPVSTHTIIDKFTATNTDSGSRTLSVYIVPSGGSANTSNLVTDAVSIASGAVYDASELKNQILNPGDFIVVAASAASVVCVRASGRECT